MKRLSLLVLFELVLSISIGLLLSKMSWIGRMGINLFRGEYKILKVWWKTALIIFALQLFFILLQYMVKRLCHLSVSRLIFFLFLLLSCLGLAYTYHDFSTVYEHKIMKERFHLGGYLFWIGFIASHLYFLVTPFQKNVQISEN
ncbi:hypothetical protein [Apibacter sp.]|uniref:hypothetical protein n=1 Tax=Apibacter sp. TaxID=2023709 RepID=UPI0025CFB357|nr:hypothetical protein [Apibacter sp.]MCT6869434.1 hypothetical protein [Apibacter sp.]